MTEKFKLEETSAGTKWWDQAINRNNKKVEAVINSIIDNDSSSGVAIVELVLKVNDIESALESANSQLNDLTNKNNNIDNSYLIAFRDRNLSIPNGAQTQIPFTLYSGNTTYIEENKVINLPVGTFILLIKATFAPNSEGVRELSLSNTNGWKEGSVIVNAVASTTSLNLIRIVKCETPQKYVVNVFQNCGVPLDLWSGNDQTFSVVVRRLS